MPLFILGQLLCHVLGAAFALLAWSTFLVAGLELHILFINPCFFVPILAAVYGFVGLFLDSLVGSFAFVSMPSVACVFEIAQVHPCT